MRSVCVWFVSYFICAFWMLWISKCVHAIVCVSQQHVIFPREIWLKSKWITHAHARYGISRYGIFFSFLHRLALKFNLEFSSFEFVVFFFLSFFSSFLRLISIFYIFLWLAHHTHSHNWINIYFFYYDWVSVSIIHRKVTYVALRLNQIEI